MPQLIPAQAPYLFWKRHKARLWARSSADLWEAIEKKSDWFADGCGIRFEKT